MDAQAADLREARTPLSSAALADLPPEDAACPRWRVSIVGPSALNIELEMRSAWTVSDWGRFARRHYGPDATVVARACPEPEPVTEEDFEERSAIPRETSDPGALWWRIAITEPGGRTVEVDTPSGWTMTDWSAYAAHYHSPGCVVTAIAGLPKPRAPVNLGEALRAACEDVAGITPAEFRFLISSEDVADVEAGAIHTKTLHAYALSFAEGIRSGRIVVLTGRTP